MSLTERALAVSRDKYEVEVGERTLKLSNLDRILYPETGFTKGDLIDYYEAIAPAMIPHLSGRPLSMRRYPEGVDHPGFWEKRCPEHRPDWVQTTRIRRSSNDEEMEYCVVNDVETLVWAANLADIELHTSLAPAGDRGRPDSVVFDLDPGAPADAIDCAEIAVLMKATFAELGLQTLIKTSGSKGLQLYVPLNTDTGYAQTREFALQVANSFEIQMPDRVVSKMKKSLRPGKVLIDWSQNSEHKTTVSVYSVRARPHPGVSTPVTWAEVEAALGSGDAADLDFSPQEALRRAERGGDLFGGLLEIEQGLPGLQ